MKRLALAMFLPCLIGCTVEISDPGDGEEDLGTVRSAVAIHNNLIPNALKPNGLQPNGLQPNGLQPNALHPTAISASAMAALQDPGEAGLLSRMLLEYTVSCAFDPTQSFTFTWTDGQGEYLEVYVGALGLATEWANAPLSEVNARWVTSCLASRTNYLGVTVVISMRGARTELATTTEEREQYVHREGAFWGNLFVEVPSLWSCHDPAEVAYSQSKNRYCAAGYPDGETLHECGILARAGECSTLCTVGSDPADGFIACDGSSEVITTFLN